MNSANCRQESIKQTVALLTVIQSRFNDKVKTLVQWDEEGLGNIEGQKQIVYAMLDLTELTDKANDLLITLQNCKQ